jgi:hypothetical protein
VDIFSKVVPSGTRGHSKQRPLRGEHRSPAEAVGIKYKGISMAIPIKKPKIEIVFIIESL